MTETTKAPVRNAALIRSVATILRTRPKTYDQSVWSELDADGAINACGTSHCIAGHALTQVGLRYGWENPKQIDGDYGKYGIYRADNNEYVGDEEASLQLGALEMGLTDEEAGILFNGEWAPITLRDIVDDEDSGYWGVDDVPASVRAAHAADALDAIADGADIRELTWSQE